MKLRLEKSDTEMYSTHNEGKSVIAERFMRTLKNQNLGFLNVHLKLYLIQNHLLLIFKIYIYNPRRSKSLMIKFLIKEIMKVKNIEEKISINNEKKHTMYKKKWQQVENVLKTKTF